MSPKKNCLVLASREKGWRENSRAGRNNLTDVWKICGLPWANRAGKSSPTHTTFGVTGVLFEPVSLSIQKNDSNPSPMAKDDPPTFLLPWKMPDLHLIRDSPTPRSTWVAQTYQCGWEAFECLPRGSNKICTKNLNKHNGGEARGLWELGWKENVGAGWKDVNSSHST